MDDKKGEFIMTIPEGSHQNPVLDVQLGQMAAFCLILLGSVLQTSPAVLQDVLQTQGLPEAPAVP